MSRPPRPHPSQPRTPGHLPPVTVVQITGSDADGDAIARPVSWDDPGPAPRSVRRAGPAVRAPIDRVAVDSRARSVPNLAT